VGICLAPKAQFATSLGQRPRNSNRRVTQALKARFNPALDRTREGSESRFQRWPSLACH
jgi:hypothetical protein